MSLMTRFSLVRLSLLFLRIGNLTFGGGDPTMAALHRELVVSRGWLSNDRYGLIYSLARATPGTNILAFCAGVGWTVARWTGALATVLSASIPCAALVVWFTYVYSTLRSNPHAMSAIGGMLAAAVGMMWAAGFQLFRPRWKAGSRARAVILTAGGFALSYGFGMAPIQILGLGALAGLLWQVPERA
jgi:chromate transporter